MSFTYNVPVLKPFGILSVIVQHFTHGSFSIGYPDGESIIFFRSLRLGGSFFFFKPPASLKTPGTLNT